MIRKTIRDITVRVLLPATAVTAASAIALMSVLAWHSSHPGPGGSVYRQESLKTAGANWWMCDLHARGGPAWVLIWTSTGKDPRTLGYISPSDPVIGPFPAAAQLGPGRSFTLPRCAAGPGARVIP